MSLNIQVVADKCEFTNEFSSGFLIPDNAQVALTKCSMDIPIFIQNIVKIPARTVAERAENAIYVTIDGIIKAITWNDIFVAHTQYIQPSGNGEIEPGLNSDTYFSGNYQYFTNNKLYLFTFPTSAANDGDKPCFSWVLAEAINRAFDFYRVCDISEWKSQAIGVAKNVATGDPAITLTGAGGHIYNNCEIHLAKQTKIKLNVNYDPFAMTKLAPTIETYPGGNITNFNAGNGILTGNGAAAMAVGNHFTMDTNGGFIRAKPNWVGGTLRWGLNISGRGLPGDGLTHSVALSTQNVIDIGIKWTSANTYQIIDGRKITPIYNGNNIEVVSTQLYNSDEPINQYNNNADFFFITCHRSSGTANNNGTEFVFTIYQGATNAINDFNNVRPIYTGKRVNLNSTYVVPTEVVTSTADANVISDLARIQTSEDTVLQMQQDSLYTVGNANTITIQALQDDFTEDIRNFWSAHGIHSFNMTDGDRRTLNDPLVDDLKSTFKISYEGTSLNKTIEWKTDYKDEDSSNTNVSQYWVGNKNLKDFFVYDSTGDGLVNTWQVNGEVSLDNLPKQLSVFILNMDLKNYQGSYHSLSGTQTQTGQTRLVSTVPLTLPDSDQVAGLDATVDYETFNPFYRPLNNPQGYITNQLQIEISFKDKDTDKRVVIKNINGLLRCEFNIRSGAKPKNKKEQELINIF